MKFPQVQPNFIFILFKPSRAKRLKYDIRICCKYYKEVQSHKKTGAYILVWIYAFVDCIMSSKILLNRLSLLFLSFENR